MLSMKIIKNRIFLRTGKSYLLDYFMFLMSDFHYEKCYIKKIEFTLKIIITIKLIQDFRKTRAYIRMHFSELLD